MADKTLVNLELHIRHPTPDGSFPITARVPATDQLADGLAVLPVDDAVTLGFFDALQEGSVDAVAVQEFGSRLFDALFQGRVKDLYVAVRARQGQAFRYRVITDHPATARLPWELLYDPERRAFLALENSLVRGFGLSEPTQPMESQPPLRILVAAAFPEDLPVIEGQEEVEVILRELADLVRRKDAEVVPLIHATPRAVQNALREALAKDRPFHILHVIGHGARDKIRDRALLFFEDEQGKSLPIDPLALADILRPFNLKLVYLNGCETATLSAFDLAQGFAPALLATGTPAVIGMQVPVWDRVASQVAQDFYAALADNHAVDQALLSARQMMRSEALQEGGIAIPVCYLRTGSGQIVDLVRTGAPKLSPATWREWLKVEATPKKLAQWAAALVVVISALLGIYWGFTTKPPEPVATPLSEMTGDFKIAVAAFGALDSQGRANASPSGSDFAQEMATGIDAAVEPLRDAGYKVQTYYPNQVGFVAGASDEERARRAEEKAQELNADLLLYGDLALQPNSTTLTPYLYISPGKVRSAEELAGRFPFGDQLQVEDSIEANIEASRQLRAALVQRTTGLAKFMVGLGHFRFDRLQNAADWFEDSLRGGNVDARSRPVIYLFLDTRAAKLGNLDGATRYYQLALESDPRYARAKLGLTQVQVQLNLGTCEQNTVGVQALEDALAAYADAARLPADLTSEVPIKASLLAGKVMVCLSHAQAGFYWEDALRDFSIVVDEFERRTSPTDQQRIQHLAAEAYGLEGMVHRVRFAPPNGCAPPDELNSAQSALEKSIRLSREANKQANSSLHLALVHICREECVAGMQAFQEAERYQRAYQDANPGRSDPAFEGFRDDVQTALLGMCPGMPNASSQSGRVP